MVIRGAMALSACSLGIGAATIALAPAGPSLASAAVICPPGTTNPAYCTNCPRGSFAGDRARGRFAGDRGGLQAQQARERCPFLFTKAAKVLDPVPDHPRGAYRGGRVRYTLTITNTSRRRASIDGVVLTDELPTQVSFVSASKQCKNDKGTVTCNLGTVTLDPGQSTEVTITVKVDDLASVPADGRTVTNTAKLACTNECIGNAQSSSARFVIWPEVDVSIKKEAPATVKRGKTIRYTVTVTNDKQSVSPARSGIIEVVDTLPPAPGNRQYTVIVRSKHSDWSCTPAKVQGPTAVGGPPHLTKITCTYKRRLDRGETSAPLLIDITPSGLAQAGDKFDNKAKVEVGDGVKNDAAANDKTSSAATTLVP